ncbi:MAG: hypothetical protein L0H64_00645 [Pseudonocardia sp.]|nr:hypothetical protein [Pseudonocardia sp.]
MPLPPIWVPDQAKNLGSTGSAVTASSSTDMFPVVMAPVFTAWATFGRTTVTETVYRKQLRPIIDDGATVMNRVLPVHRERTHGPVLSSARSI